MGVNNAAVFFSSFNLESLSASTSPIGPSAEEAATATAAAAVDEGLESTDVRDDAGRKKEMDDMVEEGSVKGRKGGGGFLIRLIRSKVRNLRIPI